jgi:hypothetical protein
MNDPIARTLKGIFVQEKQHMALTANILNAIGGSPRIADPTFIPIYPNGSPSTSVTGTAKSWGYIGGGFRSSSSGRPSS